MLTLHSDYHTRNCDMPMMLGCVTALTKTTAENGATICIPGSHVWGPERCPYDHEAVPAELEPGSALIFVGNLYHAGGANITKYVLDVSLSAVVRLLTIEQRSSQGNGRDFLVQTILPTGRESIPYGSTREGQETSSTSTEIVRLRYLPSCSWFHGVPGPDAGSLRRRRRRDR